jgi:hypothetical protein
MLAQGIMLPAILVLPNLEVFRLLLTKPLIFTPVLVILAC